MSTQRITISLQKDLYNEILSLVPSGKVSQFAQQAFTKYLSSLKLYRYKTPVQKVLTLRDSQPMLTTKEILDLIGKGRS